ncbi:lyase family protein [uncultured Corynebacterium sp.]|uniref:lyase family protein n=1 Tax=uncultured Corynebacterium sp. TaxID=159447 RepID=UPI0025D95825|nr:lyase family protein [uncultured Corynebacterium sp.]
MDLSRNTYSDLASGDAAPMRHLSDEAFLAAILEFEAALTRAAAAIDADTDADADAETDADDVDGADARAVADLIDSFDIDVPAISRASAGGGNPAIPLVKALKERVRGEGLPVGLVHRGATSQDAIDTALVLCLRRAGSDIIDLAGNVGDLLADLTRTHRTTPIVGRTLGQQATPTTFGAIAGGWLHGIDAAVAELDRAVAGLPVQYAGAAGNLAAVHPRGPEIHAALADRLGLAVGPLSWHTDRTPMVRVATALAMLAGAARKIAGDVVFHSATEVGELREATPGGSSAMPHKANPAAAIACDGYARRAPGLAATMLDSMDSRLQRATGAWHAEWQTIRDLAAVTASALDRIRASLDGITVDADAMDRNLRLTGGDILAYADDADGDPAAHLGHAPDIADAAVTAHDEFRRNRR